MTQDFIAEFESKYSAGYLGSLFKVIGSWAAWNRKPFQRKIKISNPNKRPTLENEKGSKKEEVEKMNLDDVKEEDLQDMVRQRFVGMMSGDGSRQKALPMQEVKSYITQGFE